MSTTYKPVYFATSTFTIAPENVASSATFVAGVESTAISNISNLYDDVLISGKWRSGSTPTVNTNVNIYLYTPLTDDLSSAVTYPDVLDGTSSAETFTSAGVLAGAVWLIGTLYVDTNTSARDYFMRQTSVLATVGFMPTRFGIFISHNTGVNSDTTGGNFAWYYTPLQMQSV